LIIQIEKLAGKASVQVKAKEYSHHHLECETGLTLFHGCVYMLFPQPAFLPHMSMYKANTLALREVSWVQPNFK